MARPQKGESEKKTLLVSFRVTEAEHKPLRDVAAVGGMKVNTYARLLILHGPKAVTGNGVRRSDPAVVKRLDRIGYDLKQLILKAQIEPEVSQKANALCTAIQQIIEDVAEKEEG